MNVFPLKLTLENSAQKLPVEIKRRSKNYFPILKRVIRLKIYDRAAKSLFEQGLFYKRTYLLPIEIAKMRPKHVKLCFFTIQIEASNSVKSDKNMLSICYLDLTFTITVF